MNKQKESRLFLNFLRQYLWWMALPALLGAGVGYMYQANKPMIYHQYALLELNYDLKKISEGGQEGLEKKAIIADEIVSLTREEGIRKEVGIESPMRIFKVGPVLIKVDVYSRNREKIKSELEQVVKKMKGEYPLIERGVRTEGIETANIFFGVIIGLFGGFVLGLIGSLLKSYFKHY